MVVVVVRMCCVCGVLSLLSSCSLVSLMSYIYIYKKKYTYMSTALFLLISHKKAQSRTLIFRDVCFSKLLTFCPTSFVKEV